MGSGTGELLLQHPILTQFIFPFLLIFFIVFALLKKSQILGEGDQLNAGVAFVIGLIFAAATSGVKDIVQNMIFFLTVAIVVAFVGLLLWSFISGEQNFFSNAGNGVKIAFAIVLVALIIGAIFWSTGIGGSTLGTLGETFFNQSWSNTFWTNLLFVLVIVVAIAVALKSASSSGDADSG